VLVGGDGGRLVWPGVEAGPCVEELWPGAVALWSGTEAGLLLGAADREGDGDGDGDGDGFAAGASAGGADGLGVVRTTGTGGAGTCGTLLPMSGVAGGCAMFEGDNAGGPTNALTIKPAAATLPATAVTPAIRARRSLRPEVSPYAGPPVADRALLCLGFRKIIRRRI
jgi:hypothetical protein